MKFGLKTITKTDVEKALRNIKKKKSCGIDGLSQEHLALGSKELVGPLTQIFNESISQGIFPEDWKSAISTPVLKKGEKKIMLITDLSAVSQLQQNY